MRCERRGGRRPRRGSSRCTGLGALAVLGWLGCSAAAPPSSPEYPALVLPARLAPDTPGTGAAPSSAASHEQPAAATPPVAPPAGQARARSRHGDLPDPAPLSERAQWSYTVTYDRGRIIVGQPELVCLPRPEATPRRIGRFAFELWLGRELIDRLRFDFPLLAGEEPPAGPRRPFREPPRFAPGARVSVVLRVPASERATTAHILDRATGDITAVTWPPQPTSGAARASECAATETPRR